MTYTGAFLHPARSRRGHRGLGSNLRLAGNLAECPCSCAGVCRQFRSASWNRHTCTITIDEAYRIEAENPHPRLLKKRASLRGSVCAHVDVLVEMSRTASIDATCALWMARLVARFFASFCSFSIVPIASTRKMGKTFSLLFIKGRGLVCRPFLSGPFKMAVWGASRAKLIARRAPRN